MATDFVAILATDLSCGNRYASRMARRKTYTTPPKFAMNQWARDAFDHAADKGLDLTYDEVADAMTRAQLGQVYDKSKVQKMTTIRKVSLAEAQVLSGITGFPIPDAHEYALSVDERLSRLSPDRRRRLLEMLDDLEAAEAVDPSVSQSNSGSRH